VQLLKTLLMEFSSTTLVQKRGDHDSELEEESQCCGDEELLDTACGWIETGPLLAMGTSAGLKLIIRLVMA